MLDLYTVIWGKTMIESYLEVTLPSLLQPNNLPAARELLGRYTFYSNDEAREEITQSPLYKRLIQNIKVEWLPLQKGEWETTSNTLHQMRLSASEGHYMLIMPPDNFIGNSSLLNIAKLCDGSQNPILFGFPRVNDSGWEIICSLLRQSKTISNRDLVSLAMKYIEQAYYPIQSKTSHGITHLNSWVVKHNVPTPCILPDQKLVEIFETNKTLNSGYDHTLPYIMVELGYPWHLIRHSDIFFIVERGRHLIIEGSDLDYKTWNEIKRIKGLEFFGKEETIWQGV